MEALPRRVVEIQWRNAVALQHVAEIVKGRHQVPHRLGHVGLEIGAPDDALLGLEIDQDQGPIRDGRDARDNRAFQLQYHRPRGEALES